MTKSFKDIYEEDKDIEDKVVLQPVDLINAEVDKVVIEAPVEIKREMTVLEEEVVRVDLTESIKDILTEQREQTAKVLESVLKANTKIANNVAKHVKETSKVNEKLVEAIIELTEKISLLETKLEAIENLEIPTPIVQVQLPNKTIEKIVHRDDKGLVTHVTESEISDDEDE
jgi:hypothetical protein